MVGKEKILFSEEGILFSDWSGRRGYCSVIGHLMPDTGWHSSSALGASRSLARADTCPAPAVTAAVLISEDPLGLAEQLLQGLDKCLVFFGMCFIEMYLNRRN